MISLRAAQITNETSSSLPSSREPVDSHSASGEDSEDYEEYEDEENYEDYEDESPNSVNQTNHTIVYKSSLNEGDDGEEYEDNKNDENYRIMGIPQTKTNRTIVNKHDRGEDSGDSEEYDDKNYRIMGIPQTKTNQGIAHKPERGGDYKDSEEYEEYEDEENYEDYEESPKSLNQTNHTIVYKPRLVYKSSLNEGDDKNNRTMGIPQNHGIAHKPGRGGDGKAFEEYKGSQNSVIQTKHVMVYKPSAGEGMSNSTEGVQSQDNDYNLKMHRSSKARKRKKRRRKKRKKRRKRKRKRKRKKKRKSKRKKKTKGKKPTIPKGEIDMRGRSLTEPKDPNSSRKL